MPASDNPSHAAILHSYFLTFYESMATPQVYCQPVDDITACNCMHVLECPERDLEHCYTVGRRCRNVVLDRHTIKVSIYLLVRLIFEYVPFIFLL